MFTQQRGRRCGLDAQLNEKRKEYNMQESQPFSRNMPGVRNNIHQPFIPNPGVPLNLIEVDTFLRGQDSALHPHCEDREEYSQLDYALRSGPPRLLVPAAMVIPDFQKKSECEQYESPEFWKTRNMQRPMQPYNHIQFNCDTKYR